MSEERLFPVTRLTRIAEKRGRKRVEEWFATRGWKPLRFQQEVWRRYLAGESGLLHTPTGSGKTLAALGGLLIAAAAEREVVNAAAAQKTPAQTSRPAARDVPHFKLLWITPLRALAADTTVAIRAALHGVGLDWTVGLRTGDGSAKDKRLAATGRLDVLVTTPESLSLLLSYPDSTSHFARLRLIVVDEWHELLGNKRGVLLQLALARVRGFSPAAPIWGLSATLGNLTEAKEVLLPDQPTASIVSGVRARAIRITTLLPEAGLRFAWSGHLGLSQLANVIAQIFRAQTTLLFANTRAQVELWFQALHAVWPGDPTGLAIHHGSLDPKLRQAAEEGLRTGMIRCVVATSSLDLGVDFPSVEQVIQVGSPKGVARLLQRAGRARHQPGQASAVFCVPTHALEIAEFAAARHAIEAGRIESRKPLQLSIDVLAQHCVSMALAGGFCEKLLFEQVRRTHAFRELSLSMWQAVLDFIVRGGSALELYPEYCRVIENDDGFYVVPDRKTALRHRLSIGTITSDGSVSVRFVRGGRLGSVEESFIASLRPGDAFQFAGRQLRLSRLDNMTAYVRATKGQGGNVPKWAGGRMPLSNELAHEVERVLSGAYPSPERARIATMLDLQATRSELPSPEILLVESIVVRKRHFLVLYPFAGRRVHDGLASLIALRWARLSPDTFSFAINDYGLSISPASGRALDVHELAGLLTTDGLIGDVEDSVNMTELERRQFREIARVSGLLTPSLPGRSLKSMRQVQASSGLLFDVLKRYDPEHILLQLARREVLTQQLGVEDLAATLTALAKREMRFHRLRNFSPLAFPLWAESVRGRLSSEEWSVQVHRAAERLEQRHAR